MFLAPELSGRKHGAAALGADDSPEITGALLGTQPGEGICWRNSIHKVASGDLPRHKLSGSCDWNRLLAVPLKPDEHHRGIRRAREGRHFPGVFTPGDLKDVAPTAASIDDNDITIRLAQPKPQFGVIQHGKQITVQHCATRARRV